MTSSFQVTCSNEHVASKASFAEVFNISKASGFCPQLKIAASKGDAR